MTEPLFFCEHLPAVGEVAQLNQDETRHATGARRLKRDDALWVFDGRGGLARARLQALRQRGEVLEVVIEERQQHAAQAPALHLVCALPKGDRAATLLEMATQLGMTSFTPLLCERSVVDPGAGTLKRLERVCLEACKQSRRTHLPAIGTPTKLADVVAFGDAVWIAHPDGAAVSELAHAADQPLTLLIGPEGGFTDEEVALALARDARQVSLGDAILRVETAAVALLAALRLGRTPA